MSLPPGLINLDHYTAAAQAMSEMDEHKAQMDASRQVSQKVNMLGHGGALRNKSLPLQVYVTTFVRQQPRRENVEMHMTLGTI